MANELLTPFLPDPLFLASLGKTPPPPKRPDLEELYAKLAKSSEEAPDYTGIQRVAQGRADKSSHDLAQGLALQMFGGKTASPTGRQITANAVEQGNPLRANASDVGYYDPQTGEFVENPAMRQGRTEKALLAQIAGGERVEAKAKEIAASKEKWLAELALRDAIAKGRNATNIYLGDQRLAGKGGLSNSERKEQGDLAQQLNAVNLAIEATELAPTAFGTGRGIPSGIAGQFGESLIGKLDTEEEALARAQVYNVMSSIIKARAGTAQSAHELRTLNGFLPSPYDDATQVKNKMNGFKTFLEGQKESHLESVTGWRNPTGREVTAKISPKPTTAKPTPTVDFNSLK